MRNFMRNGAACAALSALTLMLGTAIPAQAAALGWRQVFSQHYGSATNASVYSAFVATGANNAWAFGGIDLTEATGAGQPVAVHWNGRGWDRVGMPAGVTSFIFAASASSARDIWAVTFLGGYILHWNGARWSVAKHLAGFGELTGVTALSPANVWVFGSSGSMAGLGTWHFNGTTWRQQPFHTVAGGLATASALSATNIWAIGNGPALPYTSIDHFNGRSWQAVHAKALSGLLFRDIHAFSSTNVWVSAESNGIGQPAWLVHFNGRTWTRVKVPFTLETVFFSSDGRGGLWLTGQSFAFQFFIIHRSPAGAWSRSSIPVMLGDLTLIRGTTSLWAVGSRATKTGSNAVIWAHGPV
jgi:hypothetical protein